MIDDGMGSLCYDVDGGSDVMIELVLCLPFVIFRSALSYSRLGKGRVDDLWELSRRSRWSCEWLINSDCSVL